MKACLHHTEANITEFAMGSSPTGERDTLTQALACSRYHISTRQGPDTPHQNVDREYLQMSNVNPSCQIWDCMEDTLVLVPYWYWDQILREATQAHTLEVTARISVSARTRPYEVIFLLSECSIGELPLWQIMEVRGERIGYMFSHHFFKIFWNISNQPTLSWWEPGQPGPTSSVHSVS